MGRFGMWWNRLMMGRYGNDRLNRALMILCLILIAAYVIFRLRILRFAVVLLLIYIYCRMFSRNINARYSENQRFLAFEAKLRGKKYNAAEKARGYKGVKDKDHKILRCPSCGEKLRVPRGAGKIMISCPYCHTKFQKKV
jgi:hypothetical protein